MRESRDVAENTRLACSVTEAGERSARPQPAVPSRNKPALTSYEQTRPRRGGRSRGRPDVWPRRAPAAAAGSSTGGTVPFSLVGASQREAEGRFETGCKSASDPQRQAKMRISSPLNEQSRKLLLFPDGGEYLRTRGRQTPASFTTWKYQRKRKSCTCCTSARCIPRPGRTK